MELKCFRRSKAKREVYLKSVMDFICSYKSSLPLSDKESILAFISISRFRSIFPRPQLLMLNVWSASCVVLSSRTDDKLAFLTSSLADKVFDCTVKQKNKMKHILDNISKITLLSVTNLSKSEDLTVALVSEMIYHC